MSHISFEQCHKQYCSNELYLRLRLLVCCTTSVRLYRNVCMAVARMQFMQIFECYMWCGSHREPRQCVFKAHLKFYKLAWYIKHVYNKRASVSVNYRNIDYVPSFIPMTCWILDPLSTNNWRCRWRVVQVFSYVLVLCVTWVKREVVHKSYQLV